MWLPSKSQPVEFAVELPGCTAAFRVAEVRPQVNGIIKNRLFAEGIQVKLSGRGEHPLQGALTVPAAKMNNPGRNVK